MPKASFFGLGAYLGKGIDFRSVSKERVVVGKQIFSL